MWRLTKNELFIGFTLSVILSLFANFTLLMRRYDWMMDTKASDMAWEIEKYDFWFSICWFLFFSFVLFILYKWGHSIHLVNNWIIGIFSVPTVNSSYPVRLSET